MSKADHLQKPNGHSFQNFYPEACQVKPLENKGVLHVMS